MQTDCDAAADGGEELVFAEHDLRSEPGATRRPPPAQPPRAPQPPPAPQPPRIPQPPAVVDSFVIREPTGAAPLIPVDALVAGAPEPVTASQPATPAATPGHDFRVHLNSVTRQAPTADPPWTVRDPRPAPPPSQRGWSARRSDVMERSAQDTMRRLREEAVSTCWKSAWIAVTTADAGLSKRRAG